MKKKKLMTKKIYFSLYFFVIGEQIFGAIVALISSFIFAYSMNSIGEILKEMGRKENQFKLDMSNLTQYMNQRNLDSQILIKIKKYMEYLYIE